MKKISKFFAVLATFIGLAFVSIASAAPISVPSAPGTGYMLVSTTTGAYIATTTDPIHAGSFWATSTTATSSLPIASSTTFCLGGVCNTAWPVSTNYWTFDGVNSVYNNVGTDVGINNITPSYSLDVNGDVNTNGCYRVNGTCLTTGGGSPAGSINSLQYNLDGTNFGGSNLFWDNSDGWLGINGTPNSLVEVDQGSNPSGATLNTRMPRVLWNVDYNNNPSMELQAGCGSCGYPQGFAEYIDFSSNDYSDYDSRIIAEASGLSINSTGEVYLGGSFTGLGDYTGPTLFIDGGGKVGVKIDPPLYDLDVNGTIGNSSTGILETASNLKLDSALIDSTNSPGTAGQILSSTGSTINWIDPPSGGGGSGTVTSVDTNNGLTGGTITTSGTIGLDTSSLSTNALTAWNGSNLVATGTPALTAGYFIATTTSTSTLNGPLLVPQGSLASPSITFHGDTKSGIYSNSNGVDIAGNGVKQAFFGSDGTVIYGYLIGSTLGSYYISNANNSAALPAYSFFGETSTGMWSTGLTTLDFSTNGIERLKIGSTGNVGIGTTTPYAPLSVQGQTVSSYFTATTTTASTFPNASTTLASVAGGLYNTYLTSGRVPYSTTAGLLTDSANLTFNGTTLTANTLNLTNALGVSYGGTGTASAPSYGQILVGNAGGTYTLTATSSLGLGGGSGTVTSVGLSSTNSTLTVGSSPVTTSGTITADLNLSHSNNWSSLQSFGSNASTTGFSAGYAYFGTTATSSFNSAGVLTLATSTVGCLQTTSGGLVWSGTCASGSGTVTSVGLSLPTGFTVTNSPVTSSGTLTGTLKAGFSVRELPSYTVGASGADFTTIQAAMNACGTAGGGQIYLTDPAYNQGSTGLLWKGSDCAIYGRNVGTTTINFTGATTGFKTNSAAGQYTHDEIHNVSILGDATAGSVGIDMSDMSHNIYDDVVMDSWDTAYRMNDTQNITFYNKVTNGDLTTIKSFGINASSTDPANDNTFENIFIGCSNNSTNGCYAVNLNNAQNNKFYNVTAEPAGTAKTYCVQIRSSNLSTNNGTFSNDFFDFYCEGNQGGIFASSTVNRSGNATVFGNNFYGGQIETNTKSLLCESGTSCTEIGMFGTGVDFAEKTFFQANVGIATSSAATALDVNGDITDEKGAGYVGSAGSTGIVCYTTGGKLGHITITSLLASGSCVAN